MSQYNNSITIRLNAELLDWLKRKSKSNLTNINNVIRDALLLYKEFDSVPKEMQFSNLLHIQGAKAAMITFRLLKKYISDTHEGGEELVNFTLNNIKKEFDEYRIDTYKHF